MNGLTEKTSFYLFSALLQADAAIFSIVGVFVVFTLQSLQNRIDDVKDNIRTALRSFDKKILSKRIEDFDNSDIAGKKEAIQKKKKEAIQKKPSFLEERVDLLIKWYKTEKQKREIKKKLIWSSLLILLGIIYSTASLTSIGLNYYILRTEIALLTISVFHAVIFIFVVYIILDIVFHENGIRSFIIKWIMDIFKNIW